MNKLVWGISIAGILLVIVVFMFFFTARQTTTIDDNSAAELSTVNHANPMDQASTLPAGDSIPQQPQGNSQNNDAFDTKSDLSIQPINPETDPANQIARP